VVLGRARGTQWLRPHRLGGFGRCLSAGSRDGSDPPRNRSGLGLATATPFVHNRCGRLTSRRTAAASSAAPVSFRQAASKHMAMNEAYAAIEPARAEIDMLDGPTVLEFGNPWCGYCRAAQPLLASAFADHSRVRHIKIADGSGRPLGRSFKVRLWPTLVFLSNGRETMRLVRPGDASAIRRALAQIDTAE
jgi:thioredoxin 1